MRTRLLMGGVALVLLAVGSERQWPARRNANAEATTQYSGPSTHVSLTDKVVRSVSDAFDSVVRDAVLTGVKNAELMLEQYEPKLRGIYGEEGKRARELAAEVADACTSARAELEAGRTYIAMDYAIQASQDLDELKMVFERR